MKKISNILFSIVLCITLFHIRVFADNPTYNLVSSYSYEVTYGNTRHYCSNGTFNTNVRVLSVYNDNKNYGVIAFSDSSFTYSWGQSFSACPVNQDISGTSSSISYNSQTYYYVWLGAADYSPFTVTVNTDLINSINVGTYNFSQNITSASYLIKYAYGEEAVDPTPPTPTPPSYSELVNVGYNTKIAGNGDAAINNLDTITWNPEQDANGNDISDMSVTIRAVPGKYSAQTSQSILEQLYSNFVLDTLHVSELDTVNASDGSFSVTWNDVVHEFDLLGIPGFWFATKDTVKDPEGGYIKRGWIYQIRLEGEGYTGNWQTVYTATSSGVQNDLTVVNSSTINQTLINSITEINNLNNTENNWYINNTTINMGEYTDPGSSGKPWWAYLLEAIVSLLNGVIDAIANLVGSLIDGLLGLFSFDSFSIPDFAINKQTIKQNSGIFGESIDLLQGINSTLSNADGTAEPILYYPGLELMGEEFIPEITINLNTYVSDLGLTEWHNLAYVCTDAMIWISLIYTIYRKLIGVFKK